MPRCYILKKAHAQHNPIQPYGKRPVRNSKGKTTTTTTTTTISPNNATKRNIISNNNNNNTNNNTNSNISNNNTNGNGSYGSNSESCDRKNPHIRVAVIQKASRTTAANKLRSKCNNNVDKRAPRPIHETPLNDSTSNNHREYYDDNNEWKSTTMQRKKLLSSTHAMAQQNCKNKQSGPTSPTEASIAPIYYSNGDANDSKNDCVFISSEMKDAGRSTYPTNTTSYSSEFTKSTSDSATTNHMSINFTKSSPTIMATAVNNGNTVIQASSSSSSSSSSLAPSSRAHESIECTEISSSATASMICKSIPSVIHKSKTIIDAQNNMKKSNVHQTSTFSSSTVTFAPMKLSPKSTEISAIVSNPNTERQYFYESSSSSTISTVAQSLPSTNEYSLLRLASMNNSQHNHNHHNNSTNNITTPMGSIYRERSIEETEAAHDLLSLSQSLPPLPAPCVVTILHSVNNYNVNSPDVHEIAPTTKDYITYTSNTIDTNNMPNNKSIHSTNYPRSEQITYGMYVDDNTTTTMLPTNNNNINNNNNNNNKKLELKTQITPLTPPTSESSSSSDVELVNETSINNHLDYGHRNEIMDPVSNGKHANQKLSQKN